MNGSIVTGAVCLVSGVLIGGSWFTFSDPKLESAPAVVNEADKKLLPRARRSWIPENSDDYGDPLSHSLFHRYIAGKGGKKIQAAPVDAAIELIAGQGRMSGYWKAVLDEWRSGDQKSEIGCVRILGKMLETDADARHTIRRNKLGLSTAWVPFIRLPPGLVEEMVPRGRTAERHVLNHYAIAFARANVPEAREFLEWLVHEESGATFHAAIGLANLGDSTGFEWLIAHLGDDHRSRSTIYNDMHLPMPSWSNPLNVSCLKVLQALSGENELQSQEEWQAWWATVDKDALPENRVRFKD
ncbi:MAG: hypothetical protein ACI9R3_003529 [Verrucomicrobiales bacterium]|jgi:hypothetical protein